MVLANSFQVNEISNVKEGAFCSYCVSVGGYCVNVSCPWTSSLLLPHDNLAFSGISEQCGFYWIFCRENGAGGVYITHLLQSKLQIFFHLLPSPALGGLQDSPLTLPRQALVVFRPPVLLPWSWLSPGPPSVASFLLWNGLASLWALITTLHTPLPITLLRKPHLPGPAFRPSEGRPLTGPSFSHVHLSEQSLGSGGCAAQLGPVWVTRPP